MKRLSLLTLTTLIALACQRSEANPVNPEQSTALENDSSQLVRHTSCYDADEWTCEVEAAIARLTNEKRGRAPALELLFESSKVARRHSEKMLREGLSHDGFEGRGAEIKKEMPGMKIYLLGENVAQFSKGLQDPEDVAKEFVRMWWNSAGHRQNIENNKYIYIGVGVARSDSGIYATQIFHSDKSH
jgi:uncharacterized protein YkwD